MFVTAVKSVWVNPQSEPTRRMLLGSHTPASMLPLSCGTTFSIQQLSLYFTQSLNFLCLLGVKKSL